MENVCSHSEDVLALSARGSWSPKEAKQRRLALVDTTPTLKEELTQMSALFIVLLVLVVLMFLGAGIYTRR
jgi:hypothetical protein